MKQPNWLVRAARFLRRQARHLPEQDTAERCSSGCTLKNTIAGCPVHDKKPKWLKEDR